MARGTVCGRWLRIAVPFRSEEFNIVRHHAELDCIAVGTMVRQLTMEAIKQREVLNHSLTEADNNGR